MTLPRHHRLHLFALSALAVAQPLYDLVGRHATFLVAHDAGAAAVIGMMAALSIGVPLVLVGAVALARLAGPRAAVWTQTSLVALLTALLAAVALRRLPAAIALAGAAVAALAGAAAYRMATVRLFLTVLSPAILIFPLLFVTTTPAGRLVWPDRPTTGYAELERRPPIVLVVFDEMGTFTLLGPDGKIDASRFPHLAALAQTSTWFPNAVAAYPFTADALPAILTGRAPRARSGLLPIAADHPDNLFTWLSDAYELRVSEPVTQLCPLSACPRASDFDVHRFAADLLVLYGHLIVPADAAGRLPTLGLGWMGFDAAPVDAGEAGAGGAARHADAEGAPREWDLNAYFGDVTLRGRAEAFRDFTARIRGPARPVFYFVHSLLPHGPYQHLASGRIYAVAGMPDGRSDQGFWPDDPWIVEAGRDRHIEQERFADALLGELVARLKHEGLFDDALIIVTSDHGGAFVPGGHHRNADASTYQQVAAVPLLVKRPGQAEGGTSDRPVSGLDIAPTIAAALGAELPWTSDGAAIFADSFPERQTVTFDGLTPPLMLFDARAEAARRAAGPRPDAHYRPLVGQRTTDLAPAAPAPDLRVFSDNFFAFEDVRPETGYVPALVRGRIQGRPPGKGPLVLAIAVNGTIRTIARTFEWHGTTHYFAALVPEAALAPGTNRLDILIVDTVPGTSPGFRLTAVSAEITSGLELRRDDDGEYLATRSGGRIPLTAPNTGLVERLDDGNGDGGDAVVLHGWAVDQNARAPLRSIVVFSGTRALASTGIADERPDVTAALGLPPGTPVSFAISISRSQIGAGPIRLIGISATNAGELRLADDVAEHLRR